MKYLSHYMQGKQTELFNNSGAFFAFSDKQLLEQAKPGIEYVSMGGAGIICPKENAKMLGIGLDNIFVEAIKEDVAENGAAAIIRREYFNYESQISSVTEAYNSLLSYQKYFPELFTNEIIDAGFKLAWKEAVENDLF